MATQVDALYFFLLAVSAFFAVLIVSVIVVFTILYRRRSETERPEAIHGSLLLEIAWSVIPFGLAMVMFFWGAHVFLEMARPPENAMEVFVVGKQWMWKLQHMEGKREINELHVPLGRPVKLTITSEDVIHSFFIPAFRIKQDAVPGRYTSAWFEATKVGTYHLFCAEYCGTEHSKMIGKVVVMEPAAYQSWLTETTGPIAMAGAAGVDGGGAAGGTAADGQASVVQAGAQQFAKLGCVSCHRAGSGALGPSLAGIHGQPVDLQSGETLVRDDGYLRESILNSQAKLVVGYQPIMPTFKGLVTEEQLMQLIAYIKDGKAGMETP